MLKLRLLTGPRAGRQLRVSDTKPVSIGRRKGRLRLHDSRVSKNHAEITFENGLWILRDLDSANGTFVNRQQVENIAELESGDLIQIGRVLIKIVRCDGIGMDTQPALSDELLSDDLLGIGDATVESDPADGDLDLESIFGESEASDDKDDSDIFPAVNEPAAAQAPAQASPEQEEAIPEPDQIAFDEPVDDDDSFFADLSESTDTTSGAAVSVDADDLAGENEEDDPFLSGKEEEPEDTSDQISLDDESGMGPRSAGTTLLSAVPHDDLVRDAGEQSDAAPADEGNLEVDAEIAEIEDEVDDNEDADDDDAPALVGLHLEHTPPQQPEPIELAEPESEPEPDQAIAHEDETDSPETDSPELAEPAETLSEEPESGVAAEAEPIDTLAEEADDDAVIEALAEVDDTADQDNNAIDADLVDELPDEQLEVPDLSEAFAESDAESSDNLDNENQAEPVFDMGLDDLAEDDDADDLTENDLASILQDESDPIGPVAEFDDADNDINEADPADAGVETQWVGTEAEPDDEKGSDESSPFDIDAAFDELSAGLDDTSVSPAIVDEDEPPLEDESASAESAAEQAPDSLVGSQLDVGFIQDALSKLESQEAANAEPPAEDTGPKAEAASAASAATSLPQAPPPAEPYLHNPPPGLNPSSVRPPEEPGHSRVPRSNNGKWLITLLLFLGIAGGGGWYIGQNFDIQITGRDDTESSDTNNASVLPAPPTDDGSVAQQPRPVEPTLPPIDPVTPVVPQPEPRQPNGPNPFGEGPSVLGSDALEGLTRGSDDDRPLDEPRQPTIPNQPDPTTIRLPNPLPPVNPGTTVNPPSDANPPLIPGTTDSDPDAPPARIVFLVDASGSLVDSLPQMLVWLGRALQTVETDEQFAVYFFKSGKAIAIKPEGMITPSREVLNKINEDWLNPDKAPIFPSGRSNPSQAIAEALTLKPTDLYLLSDNGFAMYQGDTSSAEALELAKQAIGDSDVRVHGVQFFYRDDESVLETLANQTNGTFEFVRERVVPDADPIDLLEELGGE